MAIYADSIIEKKSIFLRNLVKDSSSGWKAGNVGTYGFYACNYETPLDRNKYYYQRFTYKFTTTNQSPTWATFYIWDGNQSGPGTGTVSAGLTPNQEYTCSLVQQLSFASYVGNGYGTIYNGNSNAIQGVTGYAKNVLIYEVSELFDYLVALGIIANTTTALKNWCDTNLVWHPCGEMYDLSSLIEDSTDKLFIKKGTIIANEIVEPHGLMIYSSSAEGRTNPGIHFFDNSNYVSVYNNKSNGNVTISRVDANAQGSPFAKDHPYVLKVTTAGEATPGAGGIVCRHYSRANAVFIERLVAKIPVGYNLLCTYNAQGTGALVEFVYPTPIATRTAPGTGTWQEYIIKYNCGTEGTFNDGGYLYLSGSNNQAVTWYIAYIDNQDLTDHPEYISAASRPGLIRIDSGIISANEFNTENLFANGDGSNQSQAFFTNSAWIYDTTDVAGNAVASFVQPVGVTSGALTPIVKINPLSRYRLSMWIKGKNDMTSYLAWIYYRNSSGTIYTHTNTAYISGTKTQLTQALNPGDTQMHIKNANSWVVNSVSRLGFRTSTADMNTETSSPNNIVSSVDKTNKIITLRTAYTGTAKAVNQYVVESFDGGTYYYPVGKGNISTDNTWKFVSVEFGRENILWDGAGGNWIDIPSAAVSLQLGLNLYTNNSTVPLKFADIRLERISSVGGYSDGRREEKIQLTSTLNYS